MKKILFLDIDGVLNNKQSKTIWSSLIPEKYGLCDFCVLEVKRIIKETNCEIVWITSWRNHKEDFVWNLEIGNKIYVLKSPFSKAKLAFNETKQTICDHLLRRDKSTDIDYFINTNNLNDINFAILDDDISQGFYEVFGDHYFRCNPRTGVTKKLADSVISYLNNNKVIKT